MIVLTFNKIKVVQVLLLIFFFCNHSFSQVTIGSKQPPVEGALLELTEGSITSKGLGMPRVKLTHEDNLFPMFWDSDTNLPLNSYTTNKVNIDFQHTGLFVYNVSEEPPFCPGLYLWTGSLWERLGGACSHLIFKVTPTTPMNFWSGRNGMVINPHELNLSWSPNEAEISYINTAVSGYSPVLIDDTSFSPLLSSHPNNLPLSFTPLPMTAEEVSDAGNPFKTKKSVLTLQVEHDGEVVKQTLDVKQTNKAIKINGSMNPVNKFYSTNRSDVASVESNAKWKISSITPANSAVSSSVVGTEYGEEREDGTASPIVDVSYQVNTGPAYSRYSYITFSDTQSPKRFNDVVLSISQCAGITDLTLKEYKDIWENVYGILPGDEPNSNGDLSKNTNKTQWHYANPAAPSDKEIFFSAEFGNAGRWMITNLATTSYPPRTDGSSTNILPSLTNNYSNSTTTAYWGYPDKNELSFIRRERIGYLYNWYAATGGVIKSTADVDGHPSIQGICPYGWHLPSRLEWRQLLDEIKEYPSLWSDHTLVNDNTTFYAMKDKCEFPGNEGKSFDILKGGFSFLLSGGFEGGSAKWWQAESVWWTSTSQDASRAHYMTFYQSYKLEQPGLNPKQRGFSVRCKKDNKF